MAERVRTGLSEMGGLTARSRTALWLIVFGVGAYVAALMFPAPELAEWYMVLPLIWFGGGLMVLGALALPWRSLCWWPIKLAAIGVAIHWTAVLPLEHWNWW